MTRSLEDYVEVSERIEKFYEKYPQGSLRCKEIRTVEIAGEHFLVYVAQAFRTADDEAPAEGAAWEPVPGKTNFTRDSELMNAETSAWGRAIAALGFEVKRGIASRQEVANRRSDGDGANSRASGEASAAQKRLCTTILNRAGVPRDFQAKVVHALAGNPPTKEGMSAILDILTDESMNEEKRADVLVEKAQLSWPSGDPEPDQTDLPVLS